VRVLISSISGRCSSIFGPSVPSSVVLNSITTSLNCFGPISTTSGFCGEISTVVSWICFWGFSYTVEITKTEEKPQKQIHETTVEISPQKPEVVELQISAPQDVTEEIIRETIEITKETEEIPEFNHNFT
jgi:hypothetical protein